MLRNVARNELRHILVIADETARIDTLQSVMRLDDLEVDSATTLDEVKSQCELPHDLAVVEHISDRVAVMYVGKLVELATSRELFSRPRHPYTQALLSAVPLPDPTRKANRVSLAGEIANPAHPPSGCHFHPRCPFATERCKQEVPVWREVSPEHYVACHFAEHIEPRGEFGNGNRA